MIFVHSSFRTASTYLWDQFRSDAKTVAYYEVFHECLDTLTVEGIRGTAPGNWNSKHPPSAPYFLEFLPLLRDGGGVAGYRPEFSVQSFIPAEGCLGQITVEETDYVRGLIHKVERHGRIPVLTDTRTVGRLRGLKAACPGLHILLYRNLFQQWCSYTEQALQGNNYFLDRTIEVIRLGRHDGFLDRLYQMFPVEAPSPFDLNTFFQFVFLHLHLYAMAAGGADVIIDVNRLDHDPAYRDEVEQKIATQNVQIDLAGAKESVAFSLLPAKLGREFEERLTVIGNMIADAAPDQLGRDFVHQVLADLLMEFRRHEFEAGAVRSLLIGPSGLLSERDTLRAERGQLAADAAQLQASYEAIRGERDELHARLDGAARDRDATRSECDGLRVERDHLTADTGRLQASYEALCNERDALHARLDAAARDLDAARAECDGLRVERGQLATEAAQFQAARSEQDALHARLDDAARDRDAVRAECDSLRADAARLQGSIEAAYCERDTLQSGLDDAARDRDAARAECNGIRTERDRLAAECLKMRTAQHAAAAEAQNASVVRDQLRMQLAEEKATCQALQGQLALLRGWAEQDRAAVLRSISWRLTRPLRRLGIDRPNRPARPGVLSGN